jgi:hypothetical protein
MVPGLRSVNDARVLRFLGNLQRRFGRRSSKQKVLRRRVAEC